MLIGLLVDVALADPPDHEARLWKIGAGTGGEVERMAVSASRNLVAGRTRDDLQGWMLDLDGWEMRTFGTGCDVTGVAPIPLYDGDEEIWMSCGDGSVRGVSWDGTAVTNVVDDNNAEIVFDAVAPALSGLWYDVDSALLYALYAPDGSFVQLHVIDPFGLTVDSALSGYPVTFADDGFVEGVVTTDGKLIVAHGGEDVSWIQLGLGNTGANHNGFAGAVWCDDLAASPFGGAYCIGTNGVAGGLGAAAEYRPALNQWLPIVLGELPDPNAICASLDLDDGWIAVTGLQVKVWEMDSDGGIPSTTPYFEGPEDADNPIQDMVTDDGYLYGGGEDGNLHIDTARPWLYPDRATVTPTTALATGDHATITFQVDTDADWVVNLHGNRDGGGTRIDGGFTPADVDVTVDLPIDDTFDEGNNFVYAIATDLNGLTGHARLTVVVDNPPQPPILTDANLAFADGGLILDYDGIDDLDLDRYQIWVSATPFTAAEWPTGGPAFDGTTDLKTPLTLGNQQPGAHVTTRIQPLENGVTYYVGVRAYDATHEGPMSKVISGMPRKTYTAAELAGEKGGTPCSTGPSSGSWWVIGAAALALASRRSRGVGAALALGGLVLASTPARAADEQDPWWKADQTNEHADFEIRYGVIGLKDQSIKTVYRNTSNLLSAEFGPQIYRIGEVDFGFGFFQELAYTVTDGDHVQSGDRTMLTWWPLYVDGTLRAHILDEQPVVPFVRYGWDYVMWSELTDNGVGGKDVLRGGKFGTHEALGLNVLLDLLQPGRASFLEARTGINDSWLTLEWRHQNVDGRSRPWSGPKQDGFDFSGDVFQAGLKLDW